MLVLTRRLNQSIMVGEMEVTVIEVRGDQIRLGIHAPKDVPVHRKEIWTQVQQENRASASSGEPPALPR